MNVDFNAMFENWKNKDLLTWIKDYDKKFYMDNKELNPDKKEIFEQIYNGSRNIRNYFYNNYLTDISDNLNCKSDKKIYEYKNFFKQVPAEGKKNYYEFYKKEQIEYYNDGNDNDTNNNDSNKNTNRRIEINYYSQNYNLEEDNEDKNKYKNNKKDNNFISYEYDKYKKIK